MNHHDLCEYPDSPLMTRLLREQRRQKRHGIVRALVIAWLTVVGWTIVYLLYRVWSWAL